MKNVPLTEQRAPSAAAGESSPQSAIVVECELADPPERVWRALTEPALLAAWLLPNDIRPEPGARFHLEDGRREDGRIKRIDCEILQAEPHRLLRYSWRTTELDPTSGGAAVESIVTFQIFPSAGGGTRLRLTHDGFAAADHGAVTMLVRGGGRGASRLRRGPLGFLQPLGSRNRRAIPQAFALRRVA